MFERFYDSSWQFPWGILALQVLATAWLLWRRPQSRWLLGFVVVFQLGIIVDNLSKTPAITGGLATFLGVTFVMLGDFRFLLLVERWASPRSEPWWRWTLPPAALAFAVPTIAWLVVDQAAGITESRVLYVFHEAMFAMLTLGILLTTWRRRDLHASSRRGILAIGAAEALQYGLWISADILIFFGHDVGFGVRVLPNLIYYVAFVPLARAVSPTPP